MSLNSQRCLLSQHQARINCHWGAWWRSKNHLLGVLGASRWWLPYGCCIQREFCRLRVAFHRTWVFTNRVGRLPFNGSMPLNGQRCLLSQHRARMSRHWGSWWRSKKNLLGVLGPSEEWTPSGCCNQREFCHLLVAFQRIWVFTDLAGCLPCPGSLLWYSQWCLMAQHRGWWSCQ